MWSPAPRLYRRIIREIAAGAKPQDERAICRRILARHRRRWRSRLAIAGIDVAALLQAARPLSLRLFGTDRQPRPASALCQQARQCGAAARRYEHPRPHRQRHQTLLARQDCDRRIRPVVGRSAPEDMWLNAYVTDFLPARENNMMCRRRHRPRARRAPQSCRQHDEVEAGQSASIAYAAYVLARNGRPVMGDLRYLTDTQLDEFDRPLARAQLAAALALLGDRGRALRSSPRRMRA